MLARQMLDWETVETAWVGNTEFVLGRYEDDWVVRVDQRILMSNRAHQSEVELAQEGIARAKDPQHVLIGGLGLGYTLRAALDLLAPTARVSVVELVSELVDWNRRFLAHLNNSPCDDPRCDVIIDDAFDVIARTKGAYDVILLDVDNGPQALSQPKNQRLYGDIGTRACWNALRPGGVLAVWSRGPNAKYVARLERFGFRPEIIRAPVGPGSRGTHVLFVGIRPTE